MTVIDKSKFRQTVYELVENDDSFMDHTKGNEAAADALTEAFLVGSISVRYDPEANAVVWRLLEIPEKASHTCTQLLNIGADLAEKGLLDEAIAILEQAVKLNPKDAVAYTNLGHAYHDKGQLSEAISNYKRALELKPDLEDAHERLGTAYADKGLFGKAITHYKNALELNPKDTVASSNLGRAYLDKGLLEEGIAQLKQTIKLDPGNAHTHNTIGLAYSRKDLPNEAIAELKLAIQLDPNNWLYHSNLGDMYFEKGMSDESIEEYKHVIELGSESAATHNNLGAAYAQKELWDKALSEFKSAIQIDPTLDIAQENFIEAQKNMMSVKRMIKDHVKKPRSPAVFHKTEAYVQLDRFENRLRLFIQQKMEQAFGNDWWKQRIPPDIQEKCLERKVKREAIPWQEVRQLHPIYYADFPYYLFIITKRDHWNQVFKSYFYNEAWIKSRLEELNVIRTDIGHTRTKMLTPRDARILEIYVGDILHCIQHSSER